MEQLSNFNLNVIGKGPQTLVLAHGFGSDQNTWHKQIEAFKDHYRLVLFDHIGCGRSNLREYNPLQYNSIERYRDDLLTIYHILGLEQSVFIGHSMSAMVGALAGLVEPTAFAKLVFIGASPRYLNDGDYIGGFEQADLERLYRAMADNYLGWANGFSAHMVGQHRQADVSSPFTQSLAAMRPDIAQSLARVIFESDLRTHLPHVRQPVLLLQSAHDPAVPRTVGTYLAATLPYSRLQVLATEGHFPHVNAAEEVNAAIHAFIHDEKI